MGKSRGGKVNQSHSTATRAAQILIDAANKLPEVHKIALGVIKPGLSYAPRRVKLTLINGGFRAEVRGSNEVQQVFLYTRDPGKTQSALENIFGGKP